MSDQFDQLKSWLTSHRTWFKPQVFKIIADDFQNELDIAEHETLILDELVELTVLELISLRDLGWFHSVDIEENDGMLILMGAVTPKFCEITHFKLHGQISFFADDGQLNCGNGHIIDRQEFEKLIELAEAYWQLSYRQY
jgi:hypothetical protein